MDKEEIEQKVRDWFESSGKMKEIQAKLRSELYEIIQGHCKSKQDLPLKVVPTQKPTPPLVKLVNWLISEHLAQNQNWLTNSVFVSEAEIEQTISVPGVIVSSQVGSRYKQYETEVVSGETVSHILNLLGFHNNQGLVETVLQNHRSKSQSVLCSLISSLALDHLKSEDVTHTRKHVEKSIPSHLQSIDNKYENILQEFNSKRREEILPKGEQCMSCANRNRDQWVENSEKRRAGKSNKARQRKDKIRIEEETSDNDTTHIPCVSEEKRYSKSNKAIERINKDVEDEKYKKLYEKIDQFLMVQEKDKGLVTDLNQNLEKAQNEILFLRQQLQIKEERSAIIKKQEEEDIAKLTSIVEKQNIKVEEQNKEIVKLRNMIEVNKLREKANTLKNQTKIDENEGKQSYSKNMSTNDSTSPITGFLDLMKNKIDEMGKENSSINDQFDDLHSADQNSCIKL